MELESKALESPATYLKEEYLNEDRSSSSFSLSTLLALVTGVAIFLGVFRISGIVALAGTLIITPALIRMIIVLEQLRRQGITIRWIDRAGWLAGSIGLVVMTLVAGALSFLAVSVFFGLMGLLLGFTVGSRGLEFDTAVVGTAGGMVWGLGGALLVITYCVCRYWLPASLRD